MEIHIRGYQPGDRDQCRSLWAELTQRHRDIYNDSGIGGEDPGREFDSHLARVGAERVWVAVEGDNIAGFVSLIVKDEETEVEPIVVAAGRRGGGIGRQLLDHVIGEAKKLDVKFLCVKPVARNVEAISFFHDAGFKTLGHIQLFMWLGPAIPGQWKKGPEMFGKQFDF